MNLLINGRGKPRASFHPNDADTGTIRIDCDKDSAVWYEIPLTRSALEMMLEQLDHAGEIEEEGEETFP